MDQLQPKEMELHLVRVAEYKEVMYRTALEIGVIDDEDEETPLVAWFQEAASKLDEYTAFVHCEKAFEKGFAKLLESYEQQMKKRGEDEEQTGEDVLLEETLMAIRYSKNKLQGIFKKHQGETMDIVYRTPVVKHRTTRVMQLQYRPVRHLKTNAILALSGKMTFRMKKEWLDFEDLYSLFQKQKSTVDIWRYFLYEASDMIERIDAHGMKKVAIQLPLPVTVATQGKTAGLIKKWKEEAEVNPARITFVLEEAALRKPAKALLKTIEKIREEGMGFAIGGYTGEITNDQLELLGIKKLVLSPSLLDRIDIHKKEQFKALIDSGYELQADGIDNDSYQVDLISMKVLSGMGSLFGEYQTDDEMLG